MNPQQIQISSQVGGNADDWRTPGFRQKLVCKIEEAILQCGAPTTKNAIEMESQVYAKAKSREEYLSFVGRLIVHITEMASKNKGLGTMSNQQNMQQQGGQIGPNNGQQMIGMQNNNMSNMMGTATGMGNMNMNTMNMNNTMNPMNQNPNNSGMMANMGLANSAVQKQSNFVMGPGGQIQQQMNQVGMSQSPSPMMQQLNQQQMTQQQQQMGQPQQQQQINFMQHSQQQSQMNNALMQNSQMQGNIQMQGMINTQAQQQQIMAARGMPNPQQMGPRMMQQPIMSNTLTQIAQANQNQQRKVRNTGPNLIHVRPGRPPVPTVRLPVPTGRLPVPTGRPPVPPGRSLVRPALPIVDVVLDLNAEFWKIDAAGASLSQCDTTPTRKRGKYATKKSPIVIDLGSPIALLGKNKPRTQNSPQVIDLAASPIHLLGKNKPSTQISPQIIEPAASPIQPLGKKNTRKTPHVVLPGSPHQLEKWTYLTENEGKNTALPKGAGAITQKIVRPKMVRKKAVKETVPKQVKMADPVAAPTAVLLPLPAGNFTLNDKTRASRVQNIDPTSIQGKSEEPKKTVMHSVYVSKECADLAYLLNDPKTNKNNNFAKFRGELTTMLNLLSDSKGNFSPNDSVDGSGSNVGTAPMVGQFPVGSPNMQRSMGPTQFMQNTAQAMSMAPSPGSMNVQGQMQNQGYGNSPGSAVMMHSPAAPGMNVNTLRPYGNQMVPSPGGVSLNTPLMVAPTPSPRNPEDQALFEKIKELRRYTDLLQRMIAKIGNEDVEKSSKMKKLLEILTNPNQRVSMEILLKCEIALKKMERQHDAGGLGSGPPVQALPPQQSQQMSSIPGKETTSPFQQLLDVVIATYKLPSSSHTYRRTFQPVLDSLVGNSIGVDEDSCEGESDEDEVELNSCIGGIPFMLSKELKLMDSSVTRVSVINKIGESNLATISCVLLDKNLPSVPPLLINLTREYPDERPSIIKLEQHYSPTPFLRSVAATLKSRLFFLPNVYTVTHLLRCWEMSVRQAANPGDDSNFQTQNIMSLSCRRTR